MDRLRPRNRPVFFGFTNAEIEKLEKVLHDSGEESLGKEFCQRLTRSFNRSSGRAGKPVIKWTEIQSWFQERLQESPEVPKNEFTHTKGRSKEGVIQDPLDLEFEARSSKDGAWYDVEKFLNHRFLSTGEAERRDQAIYYDAHILEIQRKMHDVRGCRCLFLIRYDHDDSEDKVRLRRLCRRPRS